MPITEDANVKWSMRMFGDKKIYNSGEDQSKSYAVVKIENSSWPGA